MENVTDGCSQKKKVWWRDVRQLQYFVNVHSSYLFAGNWRLDVEIHVYFSHLSPPHPTFSRPLQHSPFFPTFKLVFKTYLFKPV